MDRKFYAQLNLTIAQKNYLRREKWYFFCMSTYLVLASGEHNPNFTEKRVARKMIELSHLQSDINIRLFNIMCCNQRCLVKFDVFLLQKVKTNVCQTKNIR